MILLAENISVNKHSSEVQSEHRPSQDDDPDAKDGTPPPQEGAFCVEGLPSIAAWTGEGAFSTHKADAYAGRGTAVAMLSSGIVLAFLSFFIGDHDVPDGVLWYVAQALVYAGSIFGVTIYFRSKMGEMENRQSDNEDQKGGAGEP